MTMKHAINTPGYITQTVPVAELERTRQLERHYATGKPVRRITIEDLGGVDRHAIRPSPVAVGKVAYYRKHAEKRRELGALLIAYLQEHEPTRSGVLVTRLGFNAVRIGLVAKDLVNVRSAIACGDHEKTYWMLEK